MKACHSALAILPERSNEGSEQQGRRSWGLSLAGLAVESLPLKSYGRVDARRTAERSGRAPGTRKVRPDHDTEAGLRKTSEAEEPNGKPVGPG